MLTAPRRAGWRTSTYSSNGTDCVEVDFTESGTEIRDSKDPAGPVLVFSRDEWGNWLAEIRSGQLSNTNGAVEVRGHVGDVWQVHDAVVPGRILTFTSSEWRAFVRGVVDGEFDRSHRSALLVVVN